MSYKRLENYFDLITMGKYQEFVNELLNRPKGEWQHVKSVLSMVEIAFPKVSDSVYVIWVMSIDEPKYVVIIFFDNDDYCSISAIYNTDIAKLS